MIGMSRNEGEIGRLKGVKHDGTKAFGKRVLKNRSRNKAARKARRKQR
jgi:hypothetical protein